MLGVVIGITFYPAVDAQTLHEHCVENGHDTSWWEHEANTIHLVSGRGPSEAHLLLPYSTVKLLNDSNVDTGDDEGLNEVTGELINELTSYGKNYYDRVIRITRMVAENLDYGEEGQPQFLEGEQDLEGWIFSSSKAIDSTRNSQDDDTVHLVRFVDVRGIYEIISRPPFGNLNLVGYPDSSWNTYPWGFIWTPTLGLEEQTYSWLPIAERLWYYVSLNLPNAKYETPPIQFRFPQEKNIFEAPNHTNYGPHNLYFKDMTPWEAYASFCEKISHDVFPEFDGTFRVDPIYQHTEEYLGWADDIAADYRPLALQMGERLYARLYYLIDHEHPPRNVLTPHSFAAVFSKPLTQGWVQPVQEVAIWRGDPGGAIDTNDIEDGSLYTQKLITDTDFFESAYIGSSKSFFNDYPYVMSGDYYNKLSLVYADRSNVAYMDCTFMAFPTKSVERNGLLIDWGQEQSYVNGEILRGYPIAAVAQRIAKEHLKTILVGDLGSVVLSGLHNFGPTTRYQEVIFNAGLDGPTTTIIGKYVFPKIFPRPVKPAVEQADDTFSGIAVVYSTVPASYGDLPVASGASGDFSSYEQPYIEGDAIPLAWSEGGVLVPNVPVGEDIADYHVPFRIIRDDVLVGAGTLLFIKDGIGHILSACDYLRLAPDDTVDVDNDSVLLRNSGGRLYWGTAADFVGPAGPPGGGGGGGLGAVLPGYAIDVSGASDTVDFDPTEITAFTKTQFQFFYHNIIAGTPVKEDPEWKSVTNYQTTDDQFWWHQSGSFKFHTISDYDAGGTPGTTICQLVVNIEDEWFWKTATGYDETKTQILGHINDVWHYKTLDDWFKTLPGYAAGSDQVLGHSAGGALDWKNLSSKVIKNPTNFSATQDADSIDFTIDYTPLTIMVWPAATNGTPATLTASLGKETCD